MATATKTKNVAAKVQWMPRPHTLGEAIVLHTPITVRIIEEEDDIYLDSEVHVRIHKMRHAQEVGSINLSGIITSDYLGGSHVRIHWNSAIREGTLEFKS